MQGLKQRNRRVSCADVKPFHVRPLHLRHCINDEFAQYAWGPDLGLSESSDAMPKYQSLCNCRQCVLPSGNLQWEFRGVAANDAESEWVSENEMLESFTPLQLDGFAVLWRLYNPDAPVRKPSPSPKVLSRAEALRLFPVGFVV